MQTYPQTEGTLFYGAVSEAVLAQTVFFLYSLYYHNYLEKRGSQGLKESDFMTVKDLSVYLNMKEKTIYKLAAEGTMPGFKLGGSWRFRLPEIEAWIQAHSNRLKQRDE